MKKILIALLILSSCTKRIDVVCSTVTTVTDNTNGRRPTVTIDTVYKSYTVNEIDLRYMNHSERIVIDSLHTVKQTVTECEKQ